MDNYLTIAQFSKIAGFSRQYIYSQLNKKYAEFYKEIDGKKYLHASILETLEDKLEESEEDQAETIKNLQKQIEILNDTIEILKNSNEFWKSQLEAKDRQIHEYTKQYDMLIDVIKNDIKIMARDRGITLNDNMDIETILTPEADPKNKKAFKKRSAPPDFSGRAYNNKQKNKMFFCNLIISSHFIFSKIKKIKWRYTRDRRRNH